MMLDEYRERRDAVHDWLTADPRIHVRQAAAARSICSRTSPTCSKPAGLRTTTEFAEASRGRTRGGHRRRGFRRARLLPHLVRDIARSLARGRDADPRVRASPREKTRSGGRVGRGQRRFAKGQRLRLQKDVGTKARKKAKDTKKKEYCFQVGVSGFVFSCSFVFSWLRSWLSEAPAGKPLLAAPAEGRSARPDTASQTTSTCFGMLSERRCRVAPIAGPVVVACPDLRRGPSRSCRPFALRGFRGQRRRLRVFVAKRR